MRLQGRNTTATVRLTTDLPNIRPVRLQVGPGLTFTLSAREHPKAAEGSMNQGIGDGPSADTTTPPVLAGDPAASSHTMRASWPLGSG